MPLNASQLDTRQRRCVDGLPGAGYKATAPDKDATAMPRLPHSLATAPPRTALLCACLLAGCQPAMSTSARPGSVSFPSEDGTYSTTTDDWPLKFRAHMFRSACYSTYGCRVHYGRYFPGDDPDDVLAISSDAVPDYPNVLEASWGPIPNFPPPAKVTWRSKDGTPHQAEVDLAEIFKDGLIRHNMARDDLTRDQGVLPEIILEVNDRTINVYMRATLWTKEPQIPGNRLSNQRRDLIKVYSRTY